MVAKGAVGSVAAARAAAGLVVAARVVAKVAVVMVLVEVVMVDLRRTNGEKSEPEKKCKMRALRLVSSYIGRERRRAELCGENSEF